LRAAAPLLVKIAVPLPYGLLLIIVSASSSVSTDVHDSTWHDNTRAQAST
jgi:hypothetical protein